MDFGLRSFYVFAITQSVGIDDFRYIFFLLLQSRNFRIPLFTTVSVVVDRLLWIAG